MTNWQYKTDVNNHVLKVGDIVRITKATQKTLKYKKIDWEVVALHGYETSIKPTKAYLFKSLPDGKPADEPQLWENDRLTWKSTPVTDEALPHGFKPGDILEVKDNIPDWMPKTWVGFKAQVVDKEYDYADQKSIKVRLKPLSERPDGSVYDFWLDKQFLKLASATDAAKSPSEFKVGDLALLKIDAAGFKDFNGVPVKIVKTPADGIFKTSYRVKALRAVGSFDQFEEFWWKKDELEPFDSEKFEYKIGDRVRITGAPSSIHPIGSVGTITKKGSWGDFIVEWPGEAQHDHSHTKYNMIITDEPLTADHSTDPFIEEKPKAPVLPVVGDKVKILKNPSEEFPIGSIGVVTSVPGTVSSFYKVDMEPDDDKAYMHWHILEDLELVTEDLSGPLEVGDYVEILEKPSWSKPVGSIGYIKSLDGGSSSYPIVVKFDDGEATHYHSADQLKKVAKPAGAASKKASSKDIKIGDHVEILAKPSWKYPVGSVGFVTSVTASAWLGPIQVMFDGDTETKHYHKASDLKKTTKPLTVKKEPEKKKKKIETSSGLKIGDHVLIVSNASSYFPEGSVGVIKSFDHSSHTGEINGIYVEFADSGYDHYHDEYELAKTTLPVDTKETAKLKKELETKLGSADVLMVSELTDFSSPLGKQLVALAKIAVTMSDKTLSPVMRIETVAETLSGAGMFKK